MKKITLPFTIIALLSLSSFSLLAEESQPTSSDTNSQSTPPESNNEYVVPKPQLSRIDALKSSLTLRHLDHQIQTLDANGETFLTLYSPSLTSSTQGCVILLHSDNEHPDWPDAIAPLRAALPKYSWCTLSIEVPDIIKRASPVQVSLEDAATETSPIELPNQTLVFARIQAAIEKAKTEGVEQFAFLGYKTGASYALAFLASNASAGSALALIDIEPTPNLSEYETAQLIRQITQPVLDYYVNNVGSEQFAMWRKQAANQRAEKKGDYIQLDSIPDRVTGKNGKQLLIQRVRGFLKQNTRQINQRSALPSAKKGLFYESPISN
ncbi:hypothetical protein MACH16_25070 [Marinomonas pontica]|uniref:DUF3530 family protein n=2 Tax=Marinomonas pontica TaxID=264739 RepID=A0ABM8FFP8_9GAMM|nr:hypothetical protein MACH16_25070 [Marinomonas pontica]